MEYLGFLWIFFVFGSNIDFFLGDCVACVCAQYQYIVVGGGFSG